MMGEEGAFKSLSIYLPVSRCLSPPARVVKQSRAAALAYDDEGARRQTGLTSFEIGLDWAEPDWMAGM